MNCTTVAEELPAFVTGALDEPERIGVARHLDACPQCRAAHDSLHQDISLLGLAVPYAMPSPRLRERILAAAMADVLKLPADRRARPPAWRQFAESLFGWVRHWSPAFAAAALVVALLEGALVARLGGRLQQQQAAMQGMATSLAEADQMLTLITAPDTRVYGMEGEGAAAGAQARCYYNQQLGLGLIQTQSLPALRPGRVYQLWLSTRDSGRVSAGTFTVDAAGNGRLLFPIPHEARGSYYAGVTEEPDGGSPDPTSPRLMRTMT